MRIDALEKLVLILVGLVLFLVGVGVGALTFMFPGGMRSGVPDSASFSDAVTDEWRTNYLVKIGKLKLSDLEVTIAAPTARPGQPAPKVPVTKEEKKIAGIKSSKEYFAADELPPQERVFSYVPWLKRIPNVTYTRPKRVSASIYQKFQSFTDTWNAAQAGGGEFTETSDGQTAYQIKWVDPRSEISSMVGLKPGDKVIAVNGQPIGKSVEAGRGLYEQLKGQKRYAVMIERKGRRMVLPFYVP